jgi:hypothetical protein
VNNGQFSRLALAFSAGALTFWSPVIIARLAFGETLAVFLAIVPFTLVLPVLVCLALDALARWCTAPRPQLALAMITGIWATGPFFITLALTFTPGEGFHQAGAWSFVGLGSALFPVYTFMMAAYEGLLFAVIFTTVGLIVFAFSHWSFGRSKLG